MPLAPPKEIFTSPPAARIRLISSSCQPVRGSYALNHMALQADAVMKARVKLRSPLAEATCDSSGVGQEPMSMYGASGTAPAGGGVGGRVVVGGALVGGRVVAGGLVVAGPPVVGVVPPAQEPPLTVQLAGTPEPETMNPNTTVAPGATVPL